MSVNTYDGNIYANGDDDTWNTISTVINEEDEIIEKYKDEIIEFLKETYPEDWI